MHRSSCHILLETTSSHSDTPKHGTEKTGDDLGAADPEYTLEEVGEEEEGDLLGVVFVDGNVEDHDEVKGNVDEDCQNSNDNTDDCKDGEDQPRDEKTCFLLVRR